MATGVTNKWDFLITAVVCGLIAWVVDGLNASNWNLDEHQTGGGTTLGILLALWLKQRFFPNPGGGS